MAPERRAALSRNLGKANAVRAGKTDIYKFN